MTITIEDFKKLDLRVVKILEATPHPNADRLLVIKVDIGGETRQVIAGIKGSYQVENLVGKLAIMLCNIEPAQRRGLESQGMLLAASSENEISLLIPDKALGVGSKVS